MKPTAPAAPFDLLRRRLGLSYRGFAATLGIPYSSCYSACQGISGVPCKAAEALRELGEDPEALATAQRDWLAARGRQLRAELRARREEGSSWTG